MKQTKPANKKSTQKNIEQTNKSNKIAKNCWLSRYKRLSWNKRNYMFAPPKNKRKNNKQNQKQVRKKVMDKDMKQIE